MSEIRPFCSAAVHIVVFFFCGAAFSCWALNSKAIAQNPAITQVQNGQVRVETGIPLPLGRVGVSVEFGPPLARGVLGPGKTEPGHVLLRQLYLSGQAAGNHGDLYDNRDRDHSGLPAGDHPQMTHIRYGGRLAELGADYGLGDRLLFNAPVLGNSSTALTSGAFWRSLPRLALTSDDPTTGARLFQNYTANQIHIYPENRDHDPERGDLYPANTPYYLISQGSSRSDKPLMEAVAMIMAAFQPATKARLIEEGLLAPTVQMIFRRGQRGITSEDIYRSGLAHPSVFQAENIDLAQMVALANAITPADIPPLVRLRVTDEDRPRAGVEVFAPPGALPRTALLDTPSAIARVWHTTRYTYEMEVSATATTDPNARKLRFHWVLLRGDPARVQVIPAPDGTSARITAQWQGPRAVPGRPDILSSRIDIGVFASNGVWSSAPAFISLTLPTHEARSFAAGPDGEVRITHINRRPEKGQYYDPALYDAMRWEDRYLYDSEGNSEGWVRKFFKKEIQFDGAGNLVQSDGSTRPAPYERITDRKGRPELRISPARPSP